MTFLYYKMKGILLKMSDADNFKMLKIVLSNTNTYYIYNERCYKQLKL